MRLCAVAAILFALLAAGMLERQRAGLEVESLQLAGSPATIWRPAGGDAGQGGPPPLVVVAHGYAGSRQMMQSIAIALARAGFVVATFDFHGHGRHPEPLSGDVTSLEGATARLVEQTVAAARAALGRPDVAGPVSLVGHSMATDVVVRAAARLGDVAAVVAISMYSDAVSAESPERLLILSGAWEGRLRDVALDRLRQVDPAAGEGETVVAGDVARRAVAAPGVGHVGVLYSPTTLVETRDWIAGAAFDPAGRPPAGDLPRLWPWTLLLLGSILALAWPLAGLLGPPRPARAPALGGRRVLAVAAAPVLPALAAATLMPSGALGLGAFGALAAFFGVWGAVQLAVLSAVPWRAGRVTRGIGLAGLFLLLAWGLGLFAPALDRYGAAFVPTGPRLAVMGLLLAGTLPFCLADALIARGARLPVRAGLRLLPLAVLFGAMLITPPLGTAFTVLPVIVLFWMVYGLAGGWVAARAGPAASGLGLGIILAWALAASTPLIAA